MLDGILVQSPRHVRVGARVCPLTCGPTRTAGGIQNRQAHPSIGACCEALSWSMHCAFFRLLRCPAGYLGGLNLTDCGLDTHSVFRPGFFFLFSPAGQRWRDETADLKTCRGTPPWTALEIHHGAFSQAMVSGAALSIRSPIVPLDHPGAVVT